MTTDFSYLVVAVIFVGFFLAALVVVARRGVHIPAIRDHQVLAIFIALAFIVGGIAVGVGFVGAPSQTPTQQINTPSTYILSPTLGYFQAGSSVSTNVVDFETQATTINGVNGVLASMAVYTDWAHFVESTNHNGTTGQVIFAVTLTRTDTSLTNISLSASIPTIPSLSNATAAKSYSVVVLNTNTNEYEIYFNNNTQVPNVYVNYINLGKNVEFTVTVVVPINAALAMTQYSTQFLDLNINYGVSQSLTIPIELIRTS